MRGHQPDRLVHFLEQGYRSGLQGCQVGLATAGCLLQPWPESAPQLPDTRHLRLNRRRLDHADIACRVTGQQITVGLVELRDGGFQTLALAGALAQQQRLLGHLLAEHALGTGDVDGLRRHRHAQVQRHRGGDGEQEHQGVGEQELLVEGAHSQHAQQAVEDMGERHDEGSGQRGGQTGLNS